MIEAAILHLVVALRVGQRVIRLPKVPLAGEEGAVARLLEHRAQGPLGRRQAAALALERHRCHAAAVRYPPGLHRGPARGAARLGIERHEGHPLRGQAVDAGGRHATPLAAAIGAKVAVAGIVGDDQHDVRLLLLRGLREGRDGHRRRDQSRGPDQRPPRSTKDGRQVETRDHCSCTLPFRMMQRKPTWLAEVSTGCG